MSNKIKDIYCFGTSFTAGGGFEWKSDHPDRSRDLRKYYSEVNIEKTQEAFSWPGRFKDILKDKNLDIQVHNFGKQGYGNQRVYRKVYDVINNPKFDASTSIFIIELSWMMRREFYFYDIGDYIIANYGFLPDEKHPKRRDKLTHVNLAHSYWYDKDPLRKKLLNLEPLFTDFMKLTMDQHEVGREIHRNLSMFFSFLNENKIQYYISSLPPLDPDSRDLIKFDNSKVVKFKHDKIESDYLELFIADAKLSIRDETNGKFDDFHAGVFGNTLIASQIFNKIVDDDIFNESKVNPNPRDFLLNLI